MNVKISYTIPFEQVPEHLQKVLRDSADTAAIIDSALRSIYIDPTDVDDSLLEIDEIRKRLASLDFLLQDCYNIINGYRSRVTGQSSTKTEMDQNVQGFQQGGSSQDPTGNNASFED